MRYLEYPEYKSSSTGWLGDVPAHWEVLSIKRLTPVSRGASPRPIEDPKYFDDEGEYAWVRIADVTSNDHYLRESTQRLSELGKALSVPLEPGSLFLSIAGSVGKPMITAIKACIHDGFVYFPHLQINNEFLYYIFDSGQPYLGLGKLGTQLNLNTDTVGSIKIGLPPRDEQDAIAAFLDWKTGQIDALIAKKKELLEKLKEKRLAVITQAVTKGLNPAAPLRDSGIPWLGEVPKHWEVKRARFVMRVNPSAPRLRSLTAEDEVSFVPMDAVGVQGGLSLEQTRVLADVSGGYTEFQDGDVVVAKITPCFENGKAALANGLMNGAAFGTTELHVLRADATLDQRFLFYVAISNIFRKLGESEMYGAGGQKRVPPEFVNDFRLPLPPLTEQATIAEHLIEVTGKIDLMMNKTAFAIDRLTEYRTALITAATTGKIDVRQIAVPSMAQTSGQAMPLSGIVKK